jgi:putative membrane protein
VLLAHGAHAVDHGPVVAWLPAALLVLVPAVVYLRAVRVRRAGGRGWPALRTASFVVGLALVAVAVSPATSALGHTGARGHVVQHLLLGMFAPLALVLAAPVTLLLGALPVSRRRTARALLRSRVLHGLTHPATAAVLDMGGLYLLHLTPLYAASTTNALVHHLVNLHFLAAGSLFTWSVAGPDPAPGRPGVAVRAAVLVAAGAAHAVLAKLLYARADDLHVERSAAQLLYYGGDLAELALAVALFATWYRTRSSPQATVDRAGNRSSREGNGRQTGAAR